VRPYKLICTAVDVVACGRLPLLFVVHVSHASGSDVAGGEAVEAGCIIRNETKPTVVDLSDTHQSEHILTSCIELVDRNGRFEGDSDEEQGRVLAGRVRNLVDGCERLLDEHVLSK
jgi:hypothetical protein